MGVTATRQKYSKAFKLLRLIRQYARSILLIGLGFLFSLILVLALIYTAFQDILLSSIARQNTEFSAQVDSISGILQTAVNTYGKQVFYNPTVAYLRTSMHLTPYDKLSGIRGLSGLSSSDFAASISIYNEHESYIFTNDRSLPDAAADSFADQSTAEAFAEMESLSRMSPIRRICDNSITGKRQRYYSFILYETDEFEQSLKTGAVMINIPYKWYETQLLSFDTTGSYVLLDSTGRLIAAKRDELQSSAALFWYDISMEKRQYDTDSYLIRQIGGKRMLCLYSRMNSTGWYCMRIMPLNEYIPGLTMLRNNFTVVVVLVILLLMITSAFIMLFVYYPLHSIRDKLRGAETVADADAVSEIDQVSQLVEISRSRHQAELLNDVLSGRFSQAQEELSAPMVLIMLEPAPMRLPDRIAQRFEGALFDSRGRYALALLPNAGDKAAAAACAEISAACGCRCFCSLERASVAEMPECLSRLMQLRALRFRHYGSRVISEALIASQNPKSSFSEKNAQRLIASLRQGEADHACSLFNELLSLCKNDSLADQQFALNRITQLLRELSAELAMPEEALSALPSELDELERTADLTEPYERLFKTICDMTSERRKRHVDDIAARAAKRICDGYSAPGLSPAQIAEELGLSQAYLGRLFHASYSMSISEYLNRIRVERACELLRDTDLTIEAITAQIGFENTKYFFVVFKGLMGCTPRQYRVSSIK